VTDDARSAREHPPVYDAFSSDGHVAVWRPWELEDGEADDGTADETLTIKMDNEAWTVSGVVGREKVEYVLRISPTWQVRQFLLFRDMEEPDLWLGTDGHAHWGEINGARRPELDGCIDVDLPCTPFTNTLPIRRVPLDIGQSLDLTAVYIDVETLDVQPDRQRYTRLDTHRWRFEQPDTGFVEEFDVDRHGLVRDYPSLFRRVS
jgi:hypothetical protein